jgi:hypothetical protein
MPNRAGEPAATAIRIAEEQGHRDMVKLLEGWKQKVPQTSNSMKNDLDEALLDASSRYEL